MTILEKNQNLTDLFYYDPSIKKQAELKKGLLEYRFLLLVSSLAAKNLQDGDLEKFDALVGENACQIRAIKIAIIASEDLSYLDGLLQRLETSLAKVDTLLLPNSINALMQSGISLKDVIDQNALDIQVTSDEMFFIQSYVLSETKESLSDGEFTTSICRLEKSLPNKLKVIAPEISSSSLKSFCNKFKRLLSENSVDFVTKTALDLQNLALLKTLANFTSEHNERSCTPMFWTYKAILDLAQKKEVPMVFHAKFLKRVDSGFQMIDEEFLYFKSCPITKNYIEIIPSEKDLNTPAFVIQGAVCAHEKDNLPSKKHWIQSLKKNSAIDVILAGAANHRQYPNPDEKVSIQDQEYEYYKQLAEKNGFSLNNPTTFFIQHVYSSQANKKYTLPKTKAVI